ncbi:hypothetical protein [Demequina litorisediminis]|uniref:Uncharacterized protein n=1 Tax=Demequina litorisediminis TaxID=1849022 RepID=A0ABQ6IE50_9MICO|nr:hypothetical protein GCM10025876_23040 [Demequina litorisediminis]
MGEAMLAAPHPMVPGTVDDDYYRGDVLKVVEEQTDWVRENRPEDPTLPENRGMREENPEHRKTEHSDARLNVARHQTAATSSWRGGSI